MTGTESHAQVIEWQLSNGMKSLCTRMADRVECQVWHPQQKHSKKALGKQYDANCVHSCYQGKVTASVVESSVQQRDKQAHHRHDEIAASEVSSDMSLQRFVASTSHASAAANKPKHQCHCHRLQHYRQAHANCQSI